MSRILLADDDNASLEFMRRSLAGDGHEVATVQDGQEALERLFESGSRFDVLITDIEMPGIDGIELAKQAISNQRDLKILLVSGFADGVGRAASISGPNVVALSKPLSLEQIRAAVRSLVG